MRYVIGDVHGEAAALDGLVSEIKRRDSEAQFFFVGDFVDRGPDSQAAVDMVIDLGGHAVRGNHDDVMDLIVSGQSFSTPNASAFEAAQQAMWFLQYGMTVTLKSYGVDAKLLYRLTDTVENALKHIAPGSRMSDPVVISEEHLALCEDVLDEIRCFIPKKHTDFFRELPTVREFDDFFLVHAHVPINLEGNLTERINSLPELTQDAIWGRFTQREIREPKSWGKKGFFGHTPTMHYGATGSPVPGNSMVLIDTGATFGHGLTAYCVETDECIRVDRTGKIWKYDTVDSEV